MGQKPGLGLSRPRGTPTLKSVCVEVLGNRLELEQWRVLAYLLICLLTPLGKKTLAFFYRPIFVTAVMRSGVVAVVSLHRSIFITAIVGDGVMVVME